MALGTALAVGWAGAAAGLPAFAGLAGLGGAEDALAWAASGPLSFLAWYAAANLVGSLLVGPVLAVLLLAPVAVLKLARRPSVEDVVLTNDSARAQAKSVDKLS